MASAESEPTWHEGRYTHDECLELLEQLFPNGLAGEDVLRELAPDGWERSPLLPVFHPSIERLHEEAVHMHRNVERLAPPDRRGKTPEPTLESTKAEHRETPVDPATECRELVGMCLWDTFSDNHEAIGPDGRVADFGSFRASAGLIADFLNRRVKEPRPESPVLAELPELAQAAELLGLGASSGRYNYMDFYMGTIWVGGRADLSPVYDMIFRRLKARGFDWVYHFPRLMLVDMRPLAEAMKEEKEGEPEWASYDPSAAVAAEREQAEHDAEVERFREELDQSYRESAARAAEGPPPITVASYQRVYGHLPRGWPPVPE